MPTDPRIEAIQAQIVALAAGDLRARGVVSGRGDELDAIIAGLNMLAEDFQEREHARVRAERERRALSERSAQLLKANEALTEFAHVASHDLQEPLRMVSSFTQLLAKKYGPQLDETAQRYIQFAVEGATRMQALIVALLAYARVGEHTMSLTSCNTADIMVAMEELFGPELETTKGVLDVKHLPTVRADPLQLSRVFQNLVGNALKYRSERPPHIVVDAFHEEGHWHFMVRDNGIGFEQRAADRIWGVFTRLHTKDVYPGTGIGLAICRKIIAAHGGTTWADSKLGVGTTFHFTLPADG